MTQVLAAERGLSTDLDGFEELMEEQRNRGRGGAEDRRHRRFHRGRHQGRGDQVHRLRAPCHQRHAREARGSGEDREGHLPGVRPDAVLRRDGRPGRRHRPCSNQRREGRHSRHDQGQVRPPSPRVGNGHSVNAGEKATLHVDFARRRAINRHHSAAHLIHWALRKILGTHVRQFGTHKTPDRMRFDFTHFEQVTAAQLKECEQLINEKVIDNAPVVCARSITTRNPKTSSPSSATNTASASGSWTSAVTPRNSVAAPTSAPRARSASSRLSPRWPSPPAPPHRGCRRPGRPRPHRHQGGRALRRQPPAQRGRARCRPEI